MNFCKIALAALLIATPLTASAQSNTENAKWFVLRHDTTGDCWTGLLIEINGEFAHAFAELASPAFDNKKDALDREAELTANGTCAVAS